MLKRADESPAISAEQSARTYYDPDSDEVILIALKVMLFQIILWYFFGKPKLEFQDF
jgi:hypothetical protein